MSKRITLVSGDTVPIVRIRCLRQEDQSTAFDLTNAENALLRYWLETAPDTVRQKQLQLEAPLTSGFVRFQQDSDDFPDIGTTFFQVQVTDNAGGLITGVGISIIDVQARQ